MIQISRHRNIQTGLEPFAGGWTGFCIIDLITARPTAFDSLGEQKIFVLQFHDIPLWQLSNSLS